MHPRGFSSIFYFKQFANFSLPKTKFQSNFQLEKNSHIFTIFLSEKPQNLWENNQCALNLEQSFFTSIVGFILSRNKHVSSWGIRTLVKLNIFRRAACLKHFAYIPGNLQARITFGRIFSFLPILKNPVSTYTKDSFLKR